MPEKLPPEYVRDSSSQFIRTTDSKAADFVIAASQIEYVEDDPLDVLKTREDILKELWEEVPETYWFLRPEFRSTEPKEQWTISVGNDTINLFNYSEKISLTSDKVMSIALNIGRFAATFPNLHPELEAITIVDKPYEDPLEDDMGEAFPRAHMFMLNSYALENDIYRPDLPVARLDAVVLHELAHFEMDVHLAEDWEDAGFTWESVIYSEKLSQKSNQPEACVTEYAVRGGVYEDIAESAVAYMLSGLKLDKTKRELLERYDNWRRIPEITFKKEEGITLPQLPEELRYYVDDDETDTDQAEE